MLILIAVHQGLSMHGVHQNAAVGISVQVWWFYCLSLHWEAGRNMSEAWRFWSEEHIQIKAEVLVLCCHSCTPPFKAPVYCIVSCTVHREVVTWIQQAADHFAVVMWWHELPSCDLSENLGVCSSCYLHQCGPQTLVGAVYPDTSLRNTASRTLLYMRWPLKLMWTRHRLERPLPTSFTKQKARLGW